jgi:hypothetical protein
MGKQASLIVIQYGKYELFYSHWRAHTLPKDLFWSPEFATAFIRKQHKVSEFEWLDNFGIEGGAVIDWDAKVFLFFGGKEILYDVPLRCIYLELINRVWQGWQIKWAYQGITDLGNYIGYNFHNLLETNNKSFNQNNLCLTPKDNKIDIIASILFKDCSLHFFSLTGNIITLLQVGSSIIEKLQCQQGLGLELLFLERWNNQFPLGGFHIDMIAKTLEFWLAFPGAEIDKQIAKYWSGWKIIWYRDLSSFS